MPKQEDTRKSLGGMLGLPERVQVDNGPEFKAKSLADLFANLGLEKDASGKRRSGD